MIAVGMIMVVVPTAVMVMVVMMSGSDRGVRASNRGVRNARASQRRVYIRPGATLNERERVRDDTSGEKSRHDFLDGLYAAGKSEYERVPDGASDRTSESSHRGRLQGRR